MRALLLISQTWAGARHLRAIEMEHEHSAEAIKQPLARGPSHNGSDFLRDRLSEESMVHSHGYDQAW